MRPMLLVLGVVIILIMLRLAVWQLDRAELKNQFLQQRIELSQAPAIDLDELIIEVDSVPLIEQRYRSVTAQGVYVEGQTLFLDGKVDNTRVGYDVYSLFRTTQDNLILVKRGWVYAGLSREKLPQVSLPDIVSGRSIHGRLNALAPAPPMWDERYPSNKDNVWQYFPYDKLVEQFGQNLLPMVIELRPEDAAPGLSMQWTAIDASEVAMHKGYAFQWFSMAAAFFIACLVLLIKSFKQDK